MPYVILRMKVVDNDAFFLFCFKAAILRSIGHSDPSFVAKKENAISLWVSYLQVSKKSQYWTQVYLKWSIYKPYLLSFINETDCQYYR